MTLRELQQTIITVDKLEKRVNYLISLHQSSSPHLIAPGDTSIYVGDGTILANRTISLNGKTLRIEQGGNDLLFIDPTPGIESTAIFARNITNDGNFSGTIYQTSDTTAASSWIVSFNGIDPGVKDAHINMSALSGSSSISYTADKHTFGGNIIYSAPTVPATASDTGVTGQIAWDSGFIYICVSTNTWKRVAIATW